MAAVAMPVMTLPQFINVLQGHTQGLSLLTWSLYTVVSFVFALIGFKYREKILIVAYVPMFIIEVGITGGLILA